eukprot:5412304-Lingulodinium_polyedra.AAC.1
MQTRRPGFSSSSTSSPHHRRQRSSRARRGGKQEPKGPARRSWRGGLPTPLCGLWTTPWWQSA